MSDTDGDGQRGVESPKDGLDADRSRVELVAVDLDGSLLDPAGKVSPRTRGAVRGALDAGLRIAIATGRTWWESRSIIEQAGLTGSGVFAGGAVVNDLATGRTLAKTTIDPITAKDICAIVEQAGFPAMVLQDTSGHGAEFLVSDRIDIPRSLSDWWTYHASDIELRSDLASVPHLGTLRVTTASTPESMRVIGERLKETLGSRCYWHAIRVPAYGVEVLEVFHHAVNKWHGLVQLAAILGVDAGRIAAIGDDVNDLAMLESAMLSAAMGNALPQVKAVTHRVLQTNSEDGLAQLLEELTIAARSQR